MKSPDMAMSGRAARMRSISAEIVGGGVAAVHRLEDAVGAGLHRQMQVGHQLPEIAMRGDQFVVHVAGVAGGVAQARDAGDVCKPMQQPSQAPRSAVRPFAVPRIDVLTEQGDLANAGVGQPLGFGDDLRDRARYFRAARIGHDAEGAELVAAFLHGEEGGDAARAISARLRLRQMLELVLDGVVGLDDLLSGAHLLHHIGQAMIGLRADDEVDSRRAPR